MYKKRVTSVKNINELGKSNSTEHSLTRYRKMSYKGGNVQLEDITTHLKKWKDACNSVVKRLNSNDKERIVNTSEVRDNHPFSIKPSKVKWKRVVRQNKKHKYSNMKMLYQNAIYKSLNLNYSQSNSSVRSGTNSRDVSLKSKERNDCKNTSDPNTIQDQNLFNIKLHTNINAKSTQNSFQNSKINFKNSEEWLSNRNWVKSQRKDSPESKSQISACKDKSNAVTHQFYSPSSLTKMVKRKSKADLAIDKMLFNEKIWSYEN